MQLFYAPDLEPPVHTLGEEESKHCIRVLRLGCGDTLHLTDGRGNLYRAEITEADPRRCTVRIVATQPEFERMPYALTMCVAPTKNPDRYEWFLEKATEVGVTEIVPIETAHSERRSFKPQRGEKVITAAMKQSLKAYRPELHALTPLREIVARPFEGRRLIAHCAPARTQRGKLFLPLHAAAWRGRPAPDRPRGGLFARGDRLRAGARIRGDHTGAPTPAHRDGGSRGYGDGRHNKLFREKPGDRTPDSGLPHLTAPAGTGGTDGAGRTGGNRRNRRNRRDRRKRLPRPERRNPRQPTAAAHDSSGSVRLHPTPSDLPFLPPYSRKTR